MPIQILRSSREGTIPRWYPGWFSERFGNHVAQISTVHVLKLKNAIRDVARATHRRCPHCYAEFSRVDRCEPCNVNTYGFVPGDVEGWVKEMEEPPQGVNDVDFTFGYQNKDDDVWVEGTVSPGHTNSDEALIAYANRYPDELEIVKKAMGLGRNKSRHACGFIIANKPVDSFIPTMTVAGYKCTQFTANAVEAVGGVKMDFLIVKSIQDIQEALQLIHDRHGGRLGVMTLNNVKVPSHRIVPIPAGGFADIWDLPEDQDVFADVAEGKTETVFQFNTAGAKKYLQHFAYRRPNGNWAIDSIEAMAAFTALDRPGGIDVDVINPDWTGNPDAKEASHNMLVEYARRARGATPSPGVLPILEQLLPETQGIMVYQEQLQYVYQVITGSTGAEAEEFRRLVAKKKFDKIKGKAEKFKSRAAAKFGDEVAAALWDGMIAWARYGFNKSHAVCYVIVAYACAYLKHYYPLEWWTAILRNAKKDKINDEHWGYCGHLIRLPDIRTSHQTWEIVGTDIQAPIRLLEGIGPKAHEQLTKSAPYTDLEDFVQKIWTHRKAGEGEVTRKVPGKDEYTKKIALGPNAIHRGIIYTMIVAGAMDGMFPADSTVEHGLKLYDETYDRVFREKLGKAYKKSKRPSYPLPDALGRYQLRKSVLPAYGNDLRPEVVRIPEDQRPPCLRLYDGGRLRYAYSRWNRKLRQMEAAEEPVIGGKRLEALSVADVPDGGWRCAVIAYVEDKEVWKFKDKENGEEKPACKLTLEVMGAKYKLVHWADRHNELPGYLDPITPGSIVAAVLTRTKQGKPFSIREITMIREAPKKEKEDVG